MALPSSGQITLNQVNVELGLSGTAQIGMNDAAVRALFGVASGQITMANGYGKSSETVLTSAGLVNGQKQRQEITVSSFISSGGTLRIPSDIWVWSDTVGTAALTVNIPCTVINQGKIIGRGGNNDSGNGSSAINITSTGVTVTNSSGAYIAGGGGAASVGGGGGAGGGLGRGSVAGGTLNAAGANGANPFGNSGQGGGSGGGAQGLQSDYHYGYMQGGGGGRILPGVGGAAGVGYGGAGGSAGAAGATATGYFSATGALYPAGTSLYAGGGGGGWGASGGNSAPLPWYPPGYGFGTGGAAIQKSTSYTLSNSGTIYGAT